MKCPRCYSTEIEVSSSRGDSVCKSCGNVIEENQIVSEVTFQENPSGTVSRVGQFVSMNSTQTGWREATIRNGRKRIQSLAAQLHLTNHHVDAACRLFMLAVEYNFVQGRPTLHVIASCLYIICRTEKLPHMLLDFSDTLGINIYTLGSCFLKLVRVLNLQLPVIDPSLYIHRFASKLGFGEKTHLITMTALRLVARMKRDWLQTGRRPAGVCGACLLIAARLHGFRRTQKEIVEVVRVCDMTIRQRLNEFEDTPAARLTLGEFTEGGDNEASDPFLLIEGQPLPPSFIRNQRIEQQEQLAIEAAEKTTMSTVDKALALIEPELKINREEDSSSSGSTSNTVTERNSLIPPGISISTNNRNDILNTTNDYYKDTKPFIIDLDISTLSAKDEAEIDGFILNEDERAEREKLWNRLNKDFIEKEKEKKKEDSSGQNENVSIKRKRKRPHSEGETAADAAIRALTQRKMSNKINYDALKGLLGPLAFSETERHSCRECTESFNKEELLNAHSEVHHSSSVILICPICGIEFPTVQYSTHLHSHDSGLIGSNDSAEMIATIPPEVLIEESTTNVSSDTINKMPPPLPRTASDGMSRLNRLSKTASLTPNIPTQSPIVKPLSHKSIIMDGATLHPTVPNLNIGPSN